MELKGAISQNKDGIKLKLHVVPNSAMSIFPAGYNAWRKSIEIKVKSKPVDNKANLEIFKIVSNFFDIDCKDMLITSGHKNKEPSKPEA